MPEKFPPAPNIASFLMGNNINPMWVKWFRDIEKWCNSIRQEAYNVYTTDTNLGISDLGKVIICNIGSNNVLMTLPHVNSDDLYSWITLVRLGTGRLMVKGSDSDRIERSGAGQSIWCNEPGRVAANITLELVEEELWGILSGTGIWKTA